MGAVPEESNEKRAFEIGWEFVQEYYTIMHHEPESLYKFYGNNSYFCYGLEGESTPYCHGKDEIRKRIGDIDYNECRVVVSNVDSQPSNNGGIIVQVLGEMLNRDEQAIKFAQTFFLAEQQNGYYVLNDIFRNLKDEVNDECEELMQQVEEEKEEEVKEEPAKVEEPVKPEKIEVKETKSEKVEETKLSPTKEKKQNEAAANKPQAKPQSQPAKPQPAPAQKPAPTKEAASTAKEAVAEAPKPTSYKVAAAAADKPATNSTSTTTSTTTPSRPMTYSSIASSNATSSAKTTWSKVAAQGDGNKPSVVVKQTISSSTQKHQDNRNNNNNNNQDKDSHTVFIKLPFNINKDDISNALSRYGEIKNIEINTQKNYAFVEFATVEQARKAVQDGEFVVKNTKINIEERKRNNKNHGNGRMNSSYNRGGRPDYNRNYSGGSRGSNDSNNMGNRRGGSNNGKRIYKN